VTVPPAYSLVCCNMASQDGVTPSEGCSGGRPQWLKVLGHVESKARNWARADLAGPGVKGFGPGGAAQVASPGSPKKPKIKPKELSLLFLKSQDITDIYQKCGCSYMVFCSSQIWFLSPLKYFFQLFMFLYLLLVDLKAYCVFFHCSFCSSQDTSLIVFVFPY